MTFWIIATLDVALAVFALTFSRYVRAMRRRQLLELEDIDAREEDV